LASITSEAGKAGDGPTRAKLAARIIIIVILREILAPIGDDLPGLRDRALLLVGFAGAFRRAGAGARPRRAPFRLKHNVSAWPERAAAPESRRSTNDRRGPSPPLVFRKSGPARVRTYVHAGLHRLGGA
jgi:hypothetical protein